METLVEVHDMCKIYNPGENEVRALDHVSLQIRKGEFVAIIGHSGSGKSTLMNMLGCLDVPTSGQYFLNGKDVSHMTDDELSDIRNLEIGFIFQGFNLIPNLTAPILYEVPLMLEREGLADVVVRRLGLICHMPDLTEWATMVHKAKHPTGKVTIALVGKYVGLHDAYLSVVEALTHGGIENGVSVEIHWVNSEEATPDRLDALLAGVQGILVPGGFGSRGIDGKIEAIRYARENKIPFLGICLGMQLAVVEFARNVCGLAGAHSAELDPSTPHPVIDLMSDQVGVTAKGGTMRLGSYPCRLEEGSLAASIYGTNEISERHRHRYEFNNDYREALTKAGLALSGLSPDGRLVEVIELSDHPWFAACQFHPELKSRPNRAHPLFREFVAASMERKRKADSEI